MTGKQIKLHNRRVSILEYDDEDIACDDVILEFKHLDKNIDTKNVFYMGKYGCVITGENKIRTVSVKISREALAAIVDLAPGFLGTPE